MGVGVAIPWRVRRSRRDRQKEKTLACHEMDDGMGGFPFLGSDSVASWPYPCPLTPESIARTDAEACLVSFGEVVSNLDSWLRPSLRDMLPFLTLCSSTYSGDLYFGRVFPFPKERFSLTRVSRKTHYFSS